MILPVPDLPLADDDNPNLEASHVTIRTVGCLPNNGLAEVLASSTDGRWFRFYLKRTARVVRLFYKACGVVKGPGWLDGCVESKNGVGNYELSATLLGYDQVSDADKTYVLKEVTLREG